MYELFYIVPPPFTEKDLPGILAQVKELIEKADGKIFSQENLGNKKLAYPIKHVRRGFYILTYFEMEPQNLKEFNKKLSLTPEILRFLVVKAKEEKELVRPKKKEEIEPMAEGKGAELTVEEKIDLKALDKKIDELLEI